MVEKYVIINKRQLFQNINYILRIVVSLKRKHYELVKKPNLRQTALEFWQYSQALPMNGLKQIHFPLPESPSSHVPCPWQGLPISPGHAK